jgi:hypothetical protein
MDDGSGSQITDPVGGYNGTLHKASWTPSAVVINSSGRLLDLSSSRAKPSWALDFDKDSYVEVPDAPALNPKNFSLAFWLAPDTSSDWANVIGKQHYATGESTGWTISWDAGSPRSIVLHGFTSFNSESSSVEVPVALGEWTHLVFTVGESKIAAYKNGRLIGQTPSEDFLPTTEPFRIGGGYGNSHYFDGLIDNVLFYNTSLTQSEVQDLYRSYITTPQGFTVLEMNKTSLTLGQEMTIVARLVDQRGNALVGANVSFQISGKSLGTATTDSRGFARVPYNAKELGTFSLTAEFAGIGAYGGSAQTVQLVVTQGQSQYALFGVIGAALVLGAVAISRRRRRGGQSEDLEQAIRDLLRGAG